MADIYRVGLFSMAVRGFKRRKLRLLYFFHYMYTSLLGPQGTYLPTCIQYIDSLCCDDSICVRAGLHPSNQQDHVIIMKDRAGESGTVDVWTKALNSFVNEATT